MVLPSAETGSLRYTLNHKWSYTIDAGESQTLANGHRWIVSYDRGDGMIMSYFLKNGEHFFRREADGNWQLYKKRS